MSHGTEDDGPYCSNCKGFHSGRCALCLKCGGFLPEWSEDVCDPEHKCECKSPAMLIEPSVGPGYPPAGTYCSRHGCKRVGRAYGTQWLCPDCFQAEERRQEAEKARLEIWARERRTGRSREINLRFSVPEDWDPSETADSDDLAVLEMVDKKIRGVVAAKSYFELRDYLDMARERFKKWAVES